MYTCAKHCHKRWSSDKAIAKIKQCSFFCLTVYTNCTRLLWYLHVAAPAITCASRLWDVGSRNPVEILQGVMLSITYW